MKHWLLLLLFTVVSGAALATIDVYQFESPEQEQRYRLLIDELRCPKCQNQNLSGSDAAVAKDLKDRAYRLMQEGKSDDEIRAYLVERYGDFISYRPPFRTGTLLLWLGPLVLLVTVAGVLVWRVRRPAMAPAPLSEEEQQKLKQLLDEANARGSDHS